MALDPLNILSLCSGAIDALALGVELAVPGSRVVCHVERDAFCAGCLVQAMEAGCLDAAPVWSDARTFDGRRWRGLVDCVIGGYPCQPFSFAGKRKGHDDPRHLWPVIARIVGEIEPPLVFFENVAGHLTLGFPEVCECLEGMGYRVAAGLFTAEEVGAPHRRERLFIMAHRHDAGRRNVLGGEGQGQAVDHERSDDSGEDGKLGNARHALRPNGRSASQKAGSVGGYAASGVVAPSDSSVAHPANGGLGILRQPPGGDGQPDGSDEALDNTAGARCEATGIGPELREKRLRECVPSDGCGTLADAADAGGRRKRAGRGPNRGAAIRRAGSPVGNAERDGLRERGRATTEIADQGLPIFPPGPADRERWLDVLEWHPELEPATKPSVRGVVDELAPDRSVTNDQKRALQAIEAANLDIWRTVCRMRIDRLSPETPSRSREACGSCDPLSSLSWAAECADAVGWSESATHLRRVRQRLRLQADGQQPQDDVLPFVPVPANVEDAIRAVWPGWGQRMMQNRRHWLRALGNGVVPSQAAVAFRTLADALGIGD